MKFYRVFVGIITILMMGMLVVIAESEPQTDQSVAQFQVQELLKKSAEYISQGSHDRAIPYLEQAYDISGDQKIASALLSVYEASAEKLSERGLVNEALALLEKAKKVRSDAIAKVTSETGSKNAHQDRELVHVKQFVVGDDLAVNDVVREERSRTLFAEALKSFNQKQYGLARSLLEEGIHNNDKNPLIFELLGDIEYFSQNLSSAKAAYENSYKLDKSDRVAEKIKKLSGELKAETKLSEYLDEHFIIRYNRKEEFRGSEIREYLRDSYRVISRDLGHYLNFKTVVILYGKSDYQAIASVPHWSGALFDGKIRIPAYDDKFSTAKLKELIQHELTHVFISDISGDRCPIWLHEGLAEYQENKISPIDLRLYHFAAASKSLYTAEALEKGVSGESDELRVHVFYQQSFMIVSSLIEQFKMVSIKKLLQKLEKDAPFAESFEEIFHVQFSGYVSQMNEKAVTKSRQI